MSAYETLAGAYDGLTRDVDYAAVCDYLETVLQSLGRKPRDLLDLACGTGSVSVLLARRGYRVLGADISEDMLTVAAQKAAELGEDAPYFICQPMQRLRLPQPVDAVVCLLDSLNYLDEPEDCKRTFERVCRALRPNGVFIFDINTPRKLRGLDGQVFLDENEDSYCVWRADFDEAERRCYYGIDLFRRRGALWERSFEQHCEYAYAPDELTAWLHEAGFSEVRQFGDRRLEPPQSEEQRIYFCALKHETEESV